MPRRTANAEEQAVIRALDRLRWMVRHSEFRGDLKALRRKYPQPRPTKGNPYRSFVKMQKVLRQEQRQFAKRTKRVSFHDAYNIFLRKWNLAWFPDDLLDPSRRKRLPGTPQQYEKALIGIKHDDDRLGWQNLLAPRFAVTAEDPYYGHGWDDVEGYNQWLPPEAPERGTLLDIHVDLSYPKDVLEALISKELGKAIKERRRLHAAKTTTSSVQRFRPGQVDFQLQVYDLYQAGKNFEQIARLMDKRARTIKGRRNTVRSAYVAAVRKIQGLLGKPLPATAKPHTYDSCATCRNAETTDQFCRVGKSQLSAPLK